MNYKKLAAAAIAAVFVTGICGCAEHERKVSQKQGEETLIPMILTVDPSSGNRNEEDVVQSFNREYKGIYQVDAEWVMETEEEYRKNLKRFNVTDELPAVITDLRMLPSFYRMMVQEGRIEDLSAYIYGDEEWMDMIEPDVLESCQEPDGHIYLAPLSTNAFSCSGVFWNEELFRKAGIEKFPDTWEGFWECCQRLKEHGITPLALYTEGTAWAPMLLATAELADSPEGAEFMEELYPASYQNENGRHLASVLKRLFAYTSEDSMYVDFEVAYTNFVSGKAAMVPNGYWMIDQIPEEFAGNVRFSPFPGNKLVASPETFGWAVVSGYSDKVKKGAVEFLKYRTKYNKNEKEELLHKKASGLNQITEDYINAYNGNPHIVPNYQVKWNSVLQEETLGEYIPKLIKGEMTVEEFTQMADESIRKFNEEL